MIWTSLITSFPQCLSYLPIHLTDVIKLKIKPKTLHSSDHTSDKTQSSLFIGPCWRTPL